MTMAPVLILGGRSDIGLAIAHRFAALGHPIQLAGRDVEALRLDGSDITLRHGVEVSLHAFDVLEMEQAISFIKELDPLPGVAVCAVGVLPDQERAVNDVELATLALRTNFEGPAIVLSALASRFEARGSGTIVGIGSVAGNRGRASNYIYGAAKSGFAAFLSGLRNRLAATGVHVVTVLPGFVDTRMTRGMDLPSRLTAHPDEVATCVVRAVRRKRDVVYVKPVWRLVMLVIGLIPERVFKKLRL